jgi:hypothetical protein
MHAFIITGQDRPGGLAEVAEAIAERGINVTMISALTAAGAGMLALTTNDEASTRIALDHVRWDYREVELLPVSVEDIPGALADVARRLADAGVNIELVLPVSAARDGSHMTLALATSDAALARQVLGYLVGAAG